MDGVLGDWGEAFDQMERVATKVKQGREITLEDYRDQLRQIANLGGFEQLLDKIPGVKPEQVGRFFEGVTKDSTDEELAAIAPGFPVFRIN